MEDYLLSRKWDAEEKCAQTLLIYDNQTDILLQVGRFFKQMQMSIW